MTAEQFGDSKYKPILMPMPFGADAPSANYDIPSVGSVSNAPNFKDGFPSAFSSPKSLNGQYVTRKQINGIGNLATRYEFFRRVGGLNTFDADFAIEIGGYPRGCVLDFLYDNKLYKVLSLVDNNKVDFTGAIPTESQASHGIIAGRVDGYSWLYCNIANQVVKYNEIGEVEDFEWSGDGSPQEPLNSTFPSNNIPFLYVFDNFPIAQFTATKNGYIYIKGSSNFESSWVSVNSDFLNANNLYADHERIKGGFAIAVCEGNNNLESTSNPPVFFYSRGSFAYGFIPSGDTVTVGGAWRVRYDNSNVVSAAQVVAGHDYSIYVVNKGGMITNSTLKIIFQ